MDFFARAKRERAIAHEITNEFVRNLDALAGWPPALLAHHIGLVAERQGWVATESSMQRVLRHTLRDIKQLRRKVEKSQTSTTASAKPFDPETMAP